MAGNHVLRYVKFWRYALILGHQGLDLDDLVLTRLFGDFHDLYIYDKTLIDSITLTTLDFSPTYESEPPLVFERI